MTSLPASSDLLAVAATVLRDNKFAVTSESLANTGTSWILAESDLFVVAVAAARDVAELRQIEAFAAPELLERLRSNSALGGKRWDAYLVLMASDQPTPEAAEAEQVVDMQYDTRGMRRLVAVAVEPTGEDLRRVLRPFIPLPTTAPDMLVDAFMDLQDQLVLNGVPDDDARRLVGAYQDRGNLHDV